MSLQIDSITLREIQLPLVEPFRISSGVTTTRRILLLELVDADGASTWSECVAGDFPNYSPESIDTATLAIREWLAPRVLGRRFETPRDVSAALSEDLRGHEMAQAAIEMGAWALAATKAGQSLSSLLGGTRKRIGTGISIGIQSSPAELADKAEKALAEGYRKIKLKIKPGQDLDYLHAVRERLGPDAPLMADANNAYTLDDTDHLVQLDDLDLVMVEQPLAWDDVARHAELQRRMRTPVCLDESITNIARAEDMIRLQAGRIVNIKPGRVAGFTASKAIHDLCEANDIPVWCGGMLESGIGRAYNVALASLPNFTIPGDVSPSNRYWARDVVSPEWTMDGDGWVDVPVGTGLGVEVDRDRIEALTVQRETLRAS
ncbi:MAG: o-succinylbenzoate synthase [Holophagales bacterium]|nr:o-succinylbenzoate synthase [Holophagales bacterium]MXX63058.1 o-succinylbenzoate synthase [Holophagales bacterium]MYC09943.1 o-succinylbenzoate synthase [Holophagales bacterium]MYD21082.1 o-succinylbenzoate synthase [Holophagales bacterium]MYI33158.1 o-succinylbenzoate synthase [Holophagales bacterium]